MRTTQYKYIYLDIIYMIYIYTYLEDLLAPSSGLPVKQSCVHAHADSEIRLQSACLHMECS